MKFLKTGIPTLLLFVAFHVQAAEKTGALTGTIVSRDAATNRLTVAHAAVIGIMGAMTMPYEVRGQKVASLPKDGAKITATLHESDGTYWLTNVAAAKPMSEHAMTETHDHAAMPQHADHAQHGSEAAPQPMAGMQHGEQEQMQHGTMGGMQMQNDATSELLMR